MWGSLPSLLSNPTASLGETPAGASVPARCPQCFSSARRLCALASLLFRSESCSFHGVPQRPPTTRSHGETCRSLPTSGPCGLGHSHTASLILICTVVTPPSRASQILEERRFYPRFCILPRNLKCTEVPLVTAAFYQDSRRLYKLLVPLLLGCLKFKESRSLPSN